MRHLVNYETQVRLYEMDEELMDLFGPNRAMDLFDDVTTGQPLAGVLNGDNVTRQLFDLLR